MNSISSRISKVKRRLMALAGMGIVASLALAGCST